MATRRAATRTPTELERRSGELAARVRRAWRTVARALVARLLRGGSVTAAADRVPADWRSALETYVTGYLRDTALDVAAGERDRLGVSHPTLSDELVEDHLARSRGRLWGLGSEVWGRVRQELEVGAAAGESAAELADRVREVAGVSPRRALTIARTEVHAAAEYAAYAQVAALRLPGTKEWLATSDGRTRETHRHAAGQSVPLDGRFRVGETELRYPGDPLADPEETVNCRCSVAYELAPEATSVLTATGSTRELVLHGGDECGKIATMSDASDEGRVTALVASWNEKEHPRGHDGQFIKKGTALFDALTKGDHSFWSAVLKLTPTDWQKLTTAQKDDLQVKVYDYANETDWESQAAVDKINELLDTDTGTSINAGKIETKKTSSFDVDPDALLPVDYSSPGPPEEPVDLSNLKQSGGQAGSNPGGFYTDENTGDRYYVKKAKSEQHAANERAASLLYALAGIGTPEVQLARNAPGLGAGLQTVTALVPNAKADLQKRLGDEAYLDRLRRGFAVDAWLANWDVTGLVYDNVVSDEYGRPWRIDVGGALLYRAQGAPKGHLFGNHVGEIDTLRDAKMNPTSAKIFGSLTDQEIADSVRLVEKITPTQIDEVVAHAGLPQSVADTLKKRRLDLIQRFPGPKPTPKPDAPSPPKKVLPKKTAAGAMKTVGDAAAELEKKIAGLDQQIAQVDAALTKLKTQPPKQATPKPGTAKPLGTLPVDVPTVVVPGLHKGQAPGTKFKLTTTLVWTKHAHGTVLGVSKTATGADSRLQWNEDAKRYDLQVRDSDGTFKTIETFTKKGLWEKYGGHTLEVPGASTASSTPSLTKIVNTPTKSVDAPEPPTPINWSDLANTLPKYGELGLPALVGVTGDGKYRVVYDPEAVDPEGGIGAFAVDENVAGTWTPMPGVQPSQDVFLIRFDLKIHGAGPMLRPTHEAVATFEAIPHPSEDDESTDVDPYDVNWAVLTSNSGDPNEVLLESSNGLYRVTSGASSADTLTVWSKSNDGTWHDVETLDPDEDDLSAQAGTPNALAKYSLVWQNSGALMNPTPPTAPAAPTPEPAKFTPGEVISSWWKIDQQDFEPGQTIAVATDGKYRLVAASSGATGFDYALQQRVDENWLDIHLIKKGALPGSHQVLYDKTWAVPSDEPPPAETGFAPTPLAFTAEDVVTSWTGLDGKKFAPGQVVALSAAGWYRLVSDVYTGQQAYTLQVRDTKTGEWGDVEVISKGKLAPRMKLIGATWVVPPPGETAAYPPGTFSAPGTTQPVTTTSPTPPTSTAKPITWLLAKDVKARFKQAGAGKVGYWSKPETIWNAIQTVRVSYPDPQNPGHSLYSADQIIGALDDNVKTKEPQPFRTKITAWLQTPAGKKYAAGTSVAPTSPPAVSAPGGGPTGTTPPVVAPAPVLGLPNHPLIDANVNVPYVLKNAPSIKWEDAFALAKTASKDQVLAYGRYEYSKPAIKYRLVANGDSTLRRERYFPGVTFNGGWKVSKPVLTEPDTAVKYSTWHTAANAKIVQSTKKSTTTTTFTNASGNLGGGDVSHLSLQAKHEIYRDLRLELEEHSGPYGGLDNVSDENLYAVVKLLAGNRGLTPMQVIRAADEVYATKPKGKTKYFETRVVAWAKTPAGYAVLTGHQSDDPLKLKFASGVDPDVTLPKLHESHELDYQVLPTYQANDEWSKMVAAHGADWTAAQRASVKTYTGGTYTSINQALRGTHKPSDNVLRHIKNIQQAMRPSVRPLLLHRGVGVTALGVSHVSQLSELIGQTRRMEGFASTSVGGHSAFGGTVGLIIEAPPGTPMAWAKPVSQHPGENEMLLAAGLHYHILGVEQKPGGYGAVVRVRVVPKP